MRKKNMSKIELSVTFVFLGLKSYTSIGDVNLRTHACIFSARLLLDFLNRGGQKWLLLPNPIGMVWGGVKERTITLIILADWFCMGWHPSSHSIVPICGQAGCRAPKCLFITMTKCKWPVTKSIHLMVTFPPQHLHKVAHELSSWNFCKLLARKSFTECWLKPGARPQMSCWTVFHPARGINIFFFPQASVMFNSCAAAAKFLVSF